MTKNTLLLLFVAVPLLTMGAGCAMQGTNNQTNAGDNTPSSTVVASGTDGSDNLAVTAVIEPGVTIIKKGTGTAITATPSYVSAVAMYGKSGARFQFLNCSGNPGSLNIKRGAKFMIDNRDNESHEITMAGKTYTLGAYNFAIVSVQKIGSYNITCDGGGAAHVGVEN